MKKYYPDEATLFKQKRLSAIHRKKLFAKILKIFMVIVAILMAIAVVLVYTVF